VFNRPVERNRTSILLPDAPQDFFLWRIHVFPYKFNMPGLFYKGRGQEKNLSHGRNFSCFAAQLIEQDLF